MRASCVFVHEMKQQSSASVYIAKSSLPAFLLGVEAFWPNLYVFVSPTSHFFSISLAFLPLYPFSVDCEPAGGLIEDAFLWGATVILFGR